MNLHEESLLKYLLNPLEIADTTALLKLQNELLACGKFNCEKQAKTVSFSYNANRI